MSQVNSERAASVLQSPKPIRLRPGTRTADEVCCLNLCTDSSQPRKRNCLMCLLSPQRPHMSLTSVTAADHLREQECSSIPGWVTSLCPLYVTFQHDNGDIWQTIWSFSLMWHGLVSDIYQIWITYDNDSDPHVPDMSHIKANNRIWVTSAW